MAGDIGGFDSLDKMTALFANAQLQSVGIDFGESTDVMIIRNGKIVQWDETFTPATVEKLRRAFTPPARAAAGRIAQR